MAIAGGIGVVFADPAGHPYAVTPGAALAAIGAGAGDFVGPGSATDKAIVRFNGTTGKLGQNSTPIVQNDGRISTLTDPSSAQDAATKAYVDSHISGAGHAHVIGGTATGDGSTTAFVMAHTPLTGSVAVYVNGVRISTFTVTTNTVTFTTAPATGDELVFDYIY